MSSFRSLRNGIALGLALVTAGIVANRVSDADDAAKKETAADVQTYRNLKEKLTPRHVKHYVPFRFNFPKGWNYDAAAGTEASQNIVKVERASSLGDGCTFTQENFAIGYFTAPGKGELLRGMTDLLCEQLQKQIKAGFQGVKMNGKKDIKFGSYPGYGFDFSFKLQHPKKGEIDAWGRVVLVSSEALKQKYGLSIIMLATSEAPELKSLDDLGAKGELPIIIKSFAVDEALSNEPGEKAKEPANP